MKVFILVVLLICLTGCSATNSAKKLEVAGETQQIPWFCQQAVIAEQWECVQDAALAANPLPTRLPQAPPPAAGRLKQTFNPAPAASAGEPAPLRTQSPDTVAPAIEALPANSELTTPSTQTVDVPPHVALSYQPPRPIALVDLPGDFWAVQLIAMSSKQTLEQYAAENQLKGMSAARISDGSNFYYVLLLGIYETREKAQQAVDSLTGPLATHQPWIRRLASLQAAMERAQKLSDSPAA